MHTATSFALAPSPTIQPTVQIVRYILFMKSLIPTFFFNRNFQVVLTKSMPINSPVCLPTGKLNLSK